MVDVMDASRRGFLGGLLGVGASTAVARDTDTVRHHGPYTLTWEGWRSLQDTWAMVGFWRAVRGEDRSRFLYSTTGGIVGWARGGYALNFRTCDGWEHIAPDTPPVTFAAARQRALVRLIDALDAGEIVAEMERYS